MRRVHLVATLAFLPSLQVDFGAALALSFGARRAPASKAPRVPSRDAVVLRAADSDYPFEDEPVNSADRRERGLSRFFRSTRVADFRSDTVTKPTFAMRRAMFRADVGDDVWGDDPTVKRLEREAADMFMKDAALFTPSGTMANLIAVLSWCNRGDEFVCGDRSHIFVYEQASCAQFGGVSPRTVPNEPDGTLAIESLKAAIRPQDPLNHFPYTRLVCLENTHNMCGGKVLSPQYISSVRRLIDGANEPRPKLHLDGARIFNAATSLGVDVGTLCAPVDSVSVCLSKGLGAPAGSLLIGPEAFIRRARRIRKALGGGMRQVGVLAAPGYIALTRGPRRLKEDHDLAKILHDGVKNFNGLWASMPDSNIVMFHIGYLEADDEAHDEQRAPLPDAYEVVDKLKAEDVLVAAIDGETIRAVTHGDVTPSDALLLLNGFRNIFGTTSSLPSIVDEIAEITEIEAPEAFFGTSTPASSPAEAVEAVPSTSASSTEKERRQRVTKVQPNPDKVPEAYEDVVLHGIGCSSDGFISLLLHESTGRLLRMKVTPPDPMTIGLDVSEPESEHAITLLQLVQGMDLGGSIFPPNALQNCFETAGLSVSPSAFYSSATAPPSASSSSGMPASSVARLNIIIEEYDPQIGVLNGMLALPSPTLVSEPAAESPSEQAPESASKPEDSVADEAADDAKRNADAASAPSTAENLLELQIQTDLNAGLDQNRTAVLLIDPLKERGKDAAETEGEAAPASEQSSGAASETTGISITSEFLIAALTLRHDARIRVHRRVLGLPYPKMSTSKEATEGGTENRAEDGKSPATSEAEWVPDSLQQRLDAGAVLTLTDVEQLFPELVLVSDFAEIRDRRAAAESQANARTRREDEEEIDDE